MFWTNNEKRIKEIKKLPYVKEAKFETGCLKVEFKPTVIRMSELKFGSSEDYKNYGAYYIYVHKSSFTIQRNSAQNHWRDIKCSADHPHINGESGSGCFGNGATELQDCLNKKDLLGVTKLIWIWLHIVNHKGYDRMYHIYSNALTSGIPVWDEKGKRVELNKPGNFETRRDVSSAKTKDYSKNTEKFKGVKLKNFI